MATKLCGAGNKCSFCCPLTRVVTTRLSFTLVVYGYDLQSDDMKHLMSTTRSNCVLCFLFYKHAEIISKWSTMLSDAYVILEERDVHSCGKLCNDYTLATNIYCIMKFWDVEAKMPPPATCHLGQMSPLPSHSAATV